MIDMDEVKSILDDTLENPYWAEYYNGAPSDKCKEYIALEFYYSEYEDDETADAMDEIEKQLSADDLRWLMKFCGNNPRKGILAQKITALEK